MDTFHKAKWRKWKYKATTRLSFLIYVFVCMLWNILFLYFIPFESSNHRQARDLCIPTYPHATYQPSIINDHNIISLFSLINLSLGGLGDYRRRGPRMDRGYTEGCECSMSWSSTTSVKKMMIMVDVVVVNVLLLFIWKSSFSEIYTQLIQFRIFISSSFTHIHSASTIRTTVLDNNIVRTNESPDTQRFNSTCEWKTNGKMIKKNIFMSWNSDIVY